MLDVIIRDIDREKAGNIALYLKEMNDLVFLVTIGKGPFISSAIVTTKSESTQKGEVSENDFKAKFSGQMNGEWIQSAHFELFAGSNCIISITHSITDDAPIMMRVLINSDGEIMARKELEKGFKRAVSHQANQWMRDPKELMIENSDHLDIEEEVAIDSQEFNHNQSSDVQSGADENVSKVTQNEISLDIHDLSQRIRTSIIEVHDMINLLNEMTYDFTRGAAPNFSGKKLEEQELENGAKVELIDAEENGYTITFRKGSLEDISEVSFFLEQKGELIFSIYFSSLGNGKITTNGRNAEQLLSRIEREIKA